jgi:hypothetical protein
LRPINGRVAEWLGRGLQNLARRFESARDLKTKKPFSNEKGFFYGNSLNNYDKIFNFNPIIRLNDSNSL